MWTPKRVLLFVAGTALFFTGFEVYAHFLGGIDGLPPLPAAYFPADRNRPVTISPIKESDVDRKLRQAYGADCEEVKRPIKLDVRSKKMVLATNEVFIGDQPDGRVKLKDFSLAMFKENNASATFPEINTIKSNIAYLTFDQPISSPMEMSNRKIIACELIGNIRIRNNRGTEERSDDLEVLVLTENTPLFYDDKLNKIWTEGHVKLLDTQSRPPTMILAKGLVLYLTRENKAPAKTGPGPARRQSDTISGVDVVELRSNVEMHLWDSGSGLLGSGGKEQKKAASPKSPPAKTKVTPLCQVVIRTNGTFRYFVPRDLACFESPPGNDRDPGEAAVEDQVVVTRVHPQVLVPYDLAALVHTGVVEELGPFATLAPLAGVLKLIDRELYDTVRCDTLLLQFRRKAPEDSRSGEQASQKEIETATATARPGREVEMVSEKDSLEAHGSELLFFAATAERGPQTIIKGEPMIALKDGNKIKARELHIVAADNKGQGQRAFARGPGRIDLWDKKTQSYPHHAVWRDTLTSIKDAEGDRVYDLLTLIGEAAFVDDEHDQDLRGQRIQVWLEPAGSGAVTEAAPGPSGQRPHKLEAFGHVSTRSTELRIHDTDHLILRFKDVPPETQPQPQPASPATAAAPEPQAPPGPPQATPLKRSEGPTAPTAANAKPAPPETKSKKVIDLWARSVAAYVLRSGATNTLQEVVAEGAVHVHQDGANADDKGVDIKGETLNLVHHSQGDTLIVFGDSRDVAELQFGETYIAGPKVTINQKDNTAEVVGVGAMSMPSNTTFEGGKPARPGTRLRVEWGTYMLFEGKLANFHGGVVAYQDDSSMSCQALEVTLDRVVNFKEGQKGGQQAKVEKLLASVKVYVLDVTREKETGKLVRYQRLVTPLLDMNNQDGPVHASGPGKVYLLQYGTPDGPPSGPETASPKPKPAPGKSASEEQLMLTRIDYEGSMWSDSKAKDRTTRFRDNVEVYHQPADNPDVKVDPDHPPKGGLYLRCALLTVYSKPLPNGKTDQEMLAEKSVSFRTPEFYGTADRVKYFETLDRVIFEGTGGNYATLYQFTEPGGQPKEVKSRTILYDRKSGKLLLDGGRSIMLPGL